jgi:hypothetical protein
MDAEVKPPETPSSPEKPKSPGFWESRVWLLPLAALAVGHGWLTAGLFGQDQPWEALSDDRPIIAGWHARHLYHGYLGARAFRENYEVLAYDPSFAAGYPKTPWFDAGSKPAELFLAISGSEFKPAAYKWGLGCCIALVPLLLAMAACSAGLSHGGTFLSALLGCLLFWSDFGRSRLLAGDIDLLFASCLGVLTCAQLLAYHETPGIGTWLGLALVIALLCFIQPLVLVTLAPAFLFYYFGAGLQHRLMWHLGLAWAVVLGIGSNWLWLRAAVRFWWIQADVPSESAANPMSLQSLLDTVLTSPLFQDALHRGLALTVLGASVLGLLALKQTLAPRTIGAALVGCLALALFGNGWEPLQRVDPERFIFTALLLGAIPAVQALVSAFQLMSRLTGSTLRGGGICFVLLLAAGVALNEPLYQLGEHCLRMEALPLGLRAETRQALNAVQNQTTASARILWEETEDTDRWSPLLPVLTERSYVGGLGAGACIEHAAVRLAHGQLAGRALGDWSDADLADFCKRYNIGWIVSRTPAVATHFAKCALVKSTAPLPDGATLHTLNRPHSFFVSGQGRVLQCDSHTLALADVVPVDGHVVLSFHYQPGMLASTDRVRVEKEPQLYDAIPFVRLRVPGPISRLTLYWGE